jgi:hypothetical protein
VPIDPAAYQALQSLFVGFAFAGLLASAFELFTTKRADFRLLEVGGLAAVASVPVVVFSAPFLILRNTVRGRRIEGRPFVFVMLASMIASLWSMASGRVVLDLLDARSLTGTGLRLQSCRFMLEGAFGHATLRARRDCPGNTV